MEIPKNGLKERIKEYDYLKVIKEGKSKFNLEEAGRKPQTIDIENYLIKLVEEQRRLEIAIKINGIIFKAIELDQSLKEKVILHYINGVNVFWLDILIQ